MDNWLGNANVVCILPKPLRRGSHSPHVGCMHSKVRWTIATSITSKQTAGQQAHSSQPPFPDFGLPANFSKLEYYTSSSSLSFIHISFFSHYSIIPIVQLLLFSHYSIIPVVQIFILFTRLSFIYSLFIQLFAYTGFADRLSSPCKPMPKKWEKLRIKYLPRLFLSLSIRVHLTGVRLVGDYHCSLFYNGSGVFTCL